MSLALKSHLTEKFGLAADADDAAMKALASDKIKSGDLALDKYTELLNAKAPESGKDKAGELADSIATKTATALAPAMAAQTAALSQLADALKSRGDSAPPAPPASGTKDAANDDFEKIAAEMEKRLAEKFEKQFGDKPAGRDGDALMKMAYDDDSADGVRVKSIIERYRHQPTALVYKSDRAAALKLTGMPMEYNHKEVNKSTERTQAMSAAWAAFQICPEMLTESETDMVRHILHREKFHVPNSRNDTHARLLTESERREVWEAHKNFYTGHRKATTLINDSTSGGAYATPEFFDMDMIVTPTLANEDIPSFCHIVPVPRGSAAQNFKLGRPTLAAANTEGSAVTLFTTDALIGNHDTTFFRAAGFTNIGINFAQDAHPGIVAELMNQYMNSYRLWLNEQITSGDGTTEPQGILVASSTVNITPTTPTTGPVVLADALEMLFGVSKAYRENGGRGNAIYIMTDTTYYRFRAIATGVTGDTRLVFGDDVESYRLFNHPVLIEEEGLSNDEVIFTQMKGYRLYMRQGPRFIREDRGDTLVRGNTFIIGMDCRVGGQLDLGGYAAVATGFQT